MKSLVTRTVFLLIGAFGTDAFGVKQLRHVCLFFPPECSSPSLVKESNNRDPGERYHSFVEGEFFHDRISEIEAMGGDPFFLVDDAEDADSNKDDGDDFQDSMPSDLLTSMAMMSSSGGAMSVVGERYATDGKGPTPKEQRSQQLDDDGWEWDGTVDEEAHLDVW